MSKSAATETKIKFNAYHIVNGDRKIPVSYYLGRHGNGDTSVTIYCRDYGHALETVFGEKCVNRTDSQTDYFEKSHVILGEGDEHYLAARSRAVQNDQAWREKRAVREKITIKAFLRFHGRKPRGRGTWVIQQSNNYAAMVADLVGQPAMFNGSLEEAKRQAAARWPEAKWLAILP